ncbi:hypothetical protein AXG93_3794s1000 [Marchantia polymorpha subsp. ruderalis]|uniref:Uncharacterized protein n=1 Tax=Marchantia polymorpha subsp. ruderalis TaxID=1480154 RepID=A0A176WDW5_MARPO|nr:hypothetical protein AXG93_3794s1000 [Marchantia polymorpha subsp. ruderalis]
MVLKRNNSNLVLGAAVCFCVASAMSLLIGHVFISGAGSSICVPGLSIRCEPNDNGSQYVRCGRNQKVEDVPKGKMCYQGALISSDMRLRRSALIPSDCHKAKSLGGNSTKAFDLKSCSCSALCTGKNQCVCMCKSQAWTNVRPRLNSPSPHDHGSADTGFGFYPNRPEPVRVKEVNPAGFGLKVEPDPIGALPEPVLWRLTLWKRAKERTRGSNGIFSQTEGAYSAAVHQRR